MIKPLYSLLSAFLLSVLISFSLPACSAKTDDASVQQRVNNELKKDRAGAALNATVVPSSAFSYLSVWPDGQAQPLVSTLNAFDGAVTSNMAIAAVPNGYLDAFGTSRAHLIFDVLSYFAP